MRGHILFTEIMATFYDFYGSGTFSCAMLCHLTLFLCHRRVAHFHEARGSQVDKQDKQLSAAWVYATLEHMESGKKSRTVGWKRRFLLGITSVFSSVQ